MNKHSRKTLVLAALAMMAWQAGAALQAAVPKKLDSLKHALGWDNMNLDLVEKDEAGRPILESENNAENRVSRRTTYYPNGKKATLVFTVVSRKTGKTLYYGKKDWIDGGDLESIYVKDDVYNAKGQPMKGWIEEKHYKGGRLMMESKKKYSDETGDWKVQFKQTLSYHGNGEMKERITEDASANVKRETWGLKKSAQPGATGNSPAAAPAKD